MVLGDISEPNKRRQLELPSQKRKVDSSILSLTTDYGSVFCALTCANACLVRSCSWPSNDRCCPSRTVVRRLLSHVDRTPRPCAALTVFKSIRDSWSVTATTCVVGSRGWLVQQDHPAYIPRTGYKLASCPAHQLLPRKTSRSSLWFQSCGCTTYQRRSASMSNTLDARWTGGTATATDRCICKSPATGYGSTCPHIMTMEHRGRRCSSSSATSTRCTPNCINADTRSSIQVSSQVLATAGRCSSSTPLPTGFASTSPNQPHNAPSRRTISLGTLWRCSVITCG